MAEHGAHQQQPDQPWSGQPGYGGPPASGPPASGPPNPGPQYPPAVPGPYPPAQPGPQPGQPQYGQPVSGPAFGQPVSGPQYGQPYAPVSGPSYGGQPTSGAMVPVSGPGPGMGEQPLCQIGEIAVTTTMVHTPVGGCPLHGSQWTAQDQWISTQKTPTWAIVLAIVGFCILTIFSLLFLLAKETVLNGTIAVTVTNGPFTYVARIPVYNQAQAQHVHNQVNYARAMAMR
jgi:hypothetical protein